VYVECIDESQALAPQEELGVVGEQMLVEGESRPTFSLTGLVLHTSLGLVIEKKGDRQATERGQSRQQSGEGRTEIEREADRVLLFRLT
jgi:hypothetical protein